MESQGNSRALYPCEVHIAVFCSPVWLERPNTSMHLPYQVLEMRTWPSNPSLIWRRLPKEAADYLLGESWSPLAADNGNIFVLFLLLLPGAGKRGEEPSRLHLRLAKIPAVVEGL